METTIDIPNYSRFCGPVALSAILPHRLTRATAAHLLAGVMRHRGYVSAPSTPVDDMVIALGVLGIGAELHDARTSMRVETAAECLDRARAASCPTWERDARQVIASAPIADQPRVSELWVQIKRDRWAEFAQQRAQNAIVRDWLRHAGTWLLVSEDDTDPHWLAVRDHRIIAGEQTGRDYAGRHVIEALHVLDERSDACLN